MNVAAGVVSGLAACRHLEWDDSLPLELGLSWDLRIRPPAASMAAGAEDPQEDYETFYW